jgi:putative ABC transport system permease protein
VPALSRALLTWCGQRLGTPELAEDAAELFAAEAERHGAARARRWYRRQARSAVWSVVAGVRPRGLARRRAPGWSGGVSLDAKLGVRMLVRYPGLTLVGGLALAFAIFVGAATFEFVTQMVDPRLPLPDGDRVVGVRYWDRAEQTQALPTAADLRVWREAVRSVEHLGGFQTVERNLAGDAGADGGEPVPAARMSAAGFRVARVAPLLGRTLIESDEAPGAAPVVVLGYRVWQARFAGDAAVVGRTVRVGDVDATVVGVMPAGFAFPRDHELWLPLRLDATPDDAELRVFGRLAAGVVLAAAQAEAEAGTLAMPSVRAAGAPGEHRMTEVLPYIASFSSLRLGLVLRAMIYQPIVLAAFFVILVASNVALLMFARTATREREIVVRSALGASRRRIVGQLFVEALVLGILAGAVGLAAAAPGMRWVWDQLGRIGGGAFPFWFARGISPATVAYAFVLAVLAAVVAGVVPALKATGRRPAAGLRAAAAGAGGVRLGGVWTVVLVTQIAATVVFGGVAYVVVRQAARSASVETYFAAAQYVGVRLEMDDDATARRGDASVDATSSSTADGSTNAPSAPRGDSSASSHPSDYASAVRELERRVAAHPAVAGVAVARWLPIKARGSARIEVDDGGAAAADASPVVHFALSDAVDPDFFEVLGTPVLAGRAFDTRDLAGGVRTVVVNASFVVEALGGRSAVGRRVRYVDDDRPEAPAPWHEIVGVVGDLVADRTRSLDLEDPPRARIYHPLDTGLAGTYPVHLVAHVPSGPDALLAALHPLAAAVGPTLRIHEPLTLDRANSDIALLWQLWARLVVLVSAVALGLSLAAIYAVMSFTVARRTREIGVRIALGASTARVVADTFRRPLARMAAGVAIGCVLVALLVWAITNGRAAPRDALLLLAFGTVMTAVCALACIGPTLRALGVQPAEALSAEQ